MGIYKVIKLRKLLPCQKLISYQNFSINYSGLGSVNSQRRAAGMIQRFISSEMKSSGLSVVGLTCGTITIQSSLNLPDNKEKGLWIIKPPCSAHRPFFCNINKAYCEESSVCR
jgi:hypothetical protein